MAMTNDRRRNKMSAKLTHALLESFGLPAPSEVAV